MGDSPHHNSRGCARNSEKGNAEIKELPEMPKVPKNPKLDGIGTKAIWIF
jgi:hypothetical protein